MPGLTDPPALGAGELAAVLELLSLAERVRIAGLDRAAELVLQLPDDVFRDVTRAWSYRVVRVPADQPPALALVPRGFTCPRCGRTSANPHDRREGYCGACHDWTGTPHPEGAPTPADRAAGTIT